ncbi:dihydrofolate reductase family protein [Streptomycetaceae bacterium NBC_01309]
MTVRHATRELPFASSVFIATSLDGFIARPDGDIEWLTSRGEKAGDLGYDDFIAGVDTVVMGRATYEKLLTFGADIWPFAALHVAVLSTVLADDADSRITVYRGIDDLVTGLAARGTKHVYVDGGQVIQSFMRAGMIDRLIVTTLPVLIGSGLPLFGALDNDVDLVLEENKTFDSGFVARTYSVVR